MCHAISENCVYTTIITKGTFLHFNMGFFTQDVEAFHYLKMLFCLENEYFGVVVREACSLNDCLFFIVHYQLNGAVL